MSTNDDPKTIASHIKIIRHIPTIHEHAAHAKKPKSNRFQKISKSLSNKLGSPGAFGTAALVIILWGVSGPIFDFSDTWQLVINTTTTIVTFLMVFMIQNTQNRDSKAMQLKLDELINSNHAARTEFVDIEDLTDSELDLLHGQFKDLHEQFQAKTKK